MRIVEVLVRVTRWRFETPPRNAVSVWRDKAATLLFLRTDTGLTGVGEAWSEGISPAPVVAFLEEEVAPVLRGADPFDRGMLLDRIARLALVSCKPGLVSAGLSAADIALWDLAGQALGQPIHRLVGTRRAAVPAYASGGLYADGQTPERLGRELAGHVAAGFRAVKIKVGGARLAEDVARVAAAREAIGPDVALMLDATYAMTPSAAIAFARQVARFEPAFLETPVAPDDLAGLARVARAGGVPIAGNEYAFGTDQFRRLLDLDALAVLHAEPVLCGGITGALAAATLAAGHRVPIGLHHASTAIALLASLHVAAAAERVDSVELHMLHRVLLDRLGPAALVPRDGMLPVPTAPGLGLALDPEAVPVLTVLP